jgi:hypothetical protein
MKEGGEIMRSFYLMIAGILFLAALAGCAGSGTNSSEETHQSPTAGINWTTSHPGRPRLFDIAWSGTQFAAVGALGTILTSPDGITWTTRISGTNSPLIGITWSGTQFAAVGVNGTILTSPDGITWIIRASGTNSSLFGIAWSGTQFAAVGAAGGGWQQYNPHISRRCNMDNPHIRHD